HAAIKAVAKATPLRACPVFLQGQRSDVTELTPVQVPRGAVVHGVGPFPVTEREQSDQAEAAADVSVGAAAGEERAVSAIVLDDEQAHIQPCGRQRQQQRPAITPAGAQSPSHQQPQEHERRQRVRQLPDRATQRWLAEACAELVEAEDHFCGISLILSNARHSTFLPRLRASCYSGAGARAECSARPCSNRYRVSRRKLSLQRDCSLCGTAHKLPATMPFASPEAHLPRRGRKGRAAANVS